MDELQLGQIVELRIKNVGIIEALNLKLNPAGTKLIQIIGDNNAGKSTVLNAIEYAFRDGKHIPDAVIKDGKVESVINVETNTGYSIRKIIRETRGGNMIIKLEVKENGVSIPSPQKFLDSRFSLYHDPQAIADKDNKEMFKFLKKYAGIDFTEWDRNLTSIKEKQKLVRKAIKAYGNVSIPLTVVKYCSLDSLIQKRKEYLEYNTKQDDKKEELSRLKGLIDIHKKDIARKHTEIDASHERIAELEKMIAKEKNRIADNKNIIDNLINTIGNYETEIEKMPQPQPYKDIAAIDQELMELESHNQEALKYQETVKRVHEKEQLKEKLRDLEIEAAEIEKDKVTAMTSIEFPCKEISICDNTVIYNGYDWEMTSYSDKLLAAMEICAKMIPDNGIKFMSIHRGESILKDKRLLIAKKAKELGVTVFMEVAADNGRSEDGVFHIIEGELTDNENKGE